MRVGLMIPCHIDMFYPRVGIATLELLERLKVEVVCRGALVPTTVACLYHLFAVFKLPPFCEARVPSGARLASSWR
jgi:Fe-S oxidoreductase